MIYVPIEIIKDPELSSHDVLAYVFTQVLTYSNNYDSCILRVSDVVDQAYGECKAHTVYEKMSKSLKKLMEKGYLDIMVEKSSLYRIFMSSFSPAEETKFVKVDANDLRTIVDEIDRGKADALRYYLLLISTFNKLGVGTFERIFFATIIRCSEDSISHYTKMLEDLKLIYVYRTADFYTSNTYGLYKNKETVDIEGKKRSKGRELSSRANEKRKYVSMYYSFLDGKEYPIETLKDIYEHMEKRNKEIADLGKRARGTIYDLTPLIDKINAEC